MAESVEQIREHIEVLAAFEAKYREFVRLLEEDRHSDYGPPKHAARLEALQREILESAPRADRAGKASGHWLTTTHAPAFGGGLRSNSLTGQVMDFEEAGFTDDGLSIPRMILQTIPIQLGALRDMQLEAEKGKRTRTKQKAAQEDRGARDLQPPTVTSTPPQPWEHPVGNTAEPKRPWHENPWLVTVGGGLIVLAVTLLITQT